MESLSQSLRRTINAGAPLYNEGKKKECFELYLEATNNALSQEILAKSAIGELLSQAVEEASELGQKQAYGEAAWVLRHCFDEILEKKRPGALMLERGPRGDDSVSDTSWQDERVSHESDFEKGQAIANIDYILRASLTPKDHKRFTKTFSDCFEASAAVELLTSLGLGANRKEAVSKCSHLLKGGFIVPVSHSEDKVFKDGTHLYRFATRNELQASMDRLTADDKSNVEGTESHMLLVALQATLDISVSLEDGKEKRFSGVSTCLLLPERPCAVSPEHFQGQALADLAASVEKIIDIADRKYRLKTYKDCFVGNDAVDKIVSEGILSSREEAMEQMNALTKVGLIHHVTRDHLFEADKFYFYTFTSVKDLKKSIDAFSGLPSSAKGSELVRYSALVNRYKQFAGLDITSILNIFYGCEDKSGWDLVDLENWRRNMKRWGFGRPEDQDDDMVQRLTPLVLNVNPEDWDKSGDEQWGSPYGILAQIALFDQIPRSAFRGTPDAFKWDELAIRATKVALEKGYFDTAFKSTLNQFVLLLPLEHSESWDDQKLGVTLLLQLLSTVAVMDEGFSDYEIVKRLEFSKRLTTAFLEHAQVIAKFKRYPHRNRAQGRATTLEERIWLASDLVPRWAKSQNPQGTNNVIQLPVIPLKKITKK